MEEEVMRQLQTLTEDPREFSDAPQTCLTCQSDLRPHEALQCDDCIGDARAQMPCCFCGRPVNDREPVEVAEGLCCAGCWPSRVLRID
jgi:hypothetical protein